MMQRNNPTPLGTLGFLSRDTFNRVVPYLNHASRRALGATSPGFYRLVNICELAYLSDMPANEQIAALCKLAIHLSELNTCYTALPYSQIGTGHQDDNQAIQGLVVARLRRSMNGVFANDLVAALTLTCLARLDPTSYDEHQAHRVLAFSNIHPALARSLRKLIYPAHHPLLVLMPDAFMLPTNQEIGNLPRGPIRALCRAIENPNAVQERAPQQSIHGDQSIHRYQKSEHFSSAQAYASLKTNPPKAIMSSLLLKLNQDDQNAIWQWLSFYIHTSDVCEAILSALPKLMEKWGNSIPEQFSAFLNVEANLKKAVNRAELLAWHIEVFSILLSSENTSIKRKASNLLIAQLITSLTLSDSEVADLITPLNDVELQICFSSILCLEKEKNISRIASLIERLLARMDPAIAAFLLEWAIEHRAPDESNCYVSLIHYAKSIKSRELNERIFLKLTHETIQRKRHGQPVAKFARVLLALLPTTDTELEIIGPLIQTLLLNKQSSDERLDKIPILCKIMLQEWFAFGCDHSLGINLIRRLIMGLSHEQVFELFKFVTEAYLPNKKIWNTLSATGKSLWLDRYSTLYLCMAHKLPIDSLIKSRLFIVLKSRRNRDDAVAINLLAKHFFQSDMARLELLEFIQELIIKTQNFLFAKAIFEQLPDFSVKLNDEEQASLVNMLCQFLEYSLIADSDLVENVLATLNKMSSRLTSQQALKVFKHLESVIIRNESKHILPIINLLVAMKDKIPFYKNSTINYTMSRVKNMLRSWLNLVTYDTYLKHQVRNAALHALGQYVDHLNEEDIDDMLARFHTAANGPIRHLSDPSFLIPVMHLLSSEQLRAVIADIHGMELLTRNDSSAIEAKVISKIIARLKDIGQGDHVLTLCEPSRYQAACSTQLSGLLMEKTLRRPLLQNVLWPDEMRQFLVDRICTPAFEPANSPLKLAANIVTYIKSINHMQGTARFDDEHRSETTKVKSLLAMETISACLSCYKGTTSAKIILFHLVLLQLSIEAADRDLEFLFPKWDFSVYRRYHDLETRVIAYRTKNDLKKYAVDELRLEIDKLSDIDDPLIPHSIIQCLFQLEISNNDSKEKAINAIRDYCIRVENVERLNELTWLLVETRKNELAPLLQRKHSLSIHRHILSPLELYDFGINQEEPCSGTAVKIFKIIHDARIALLKAHPQVLALAEVDDDDFVVITHRKY